VRILVFGLPGTGKTTVAKMLARKMGAAHINADNVRSIHDDWDMTPAGRERQCRRMKTLSELGSGNVVVDFVCPLQEYRDIFDADINVWVNTKEKCRYPTTNRMFEKPPNPHFAINDYSEIEEVVGCIVEACQAGKMARSYHES